MDPFRNHRDRSQTIDSNFFEQTEAKRQHLEMQEVALRELLGLFRDARWLKVRERLMEELNAAVNRLVDPLDDIKTATLRGQISALRRIIGYEALLENDIKITQEKLDQCIKTLDAASS